ncbi:MAG TPA: carboxylesterase family protein [Terriglobales bacterium]|nr:carboxylesterase family protein [Terriglobales bacterium]
MRNVFAIGIIAAQILFFSVQDESIARQTNEYWANFAKSGDPNGDTLPKWPRYMKADELLIIESAGPKAEPAPWKARLDLVQKLAEGKEKSAAGGTK